jgi:branched-chain amino acid transport system substrate-binding protein
MKKATVVFLVSMFLLVSAVAVFAQQFDDIIKIGAAVSLTGKTAYEGQMVKRGYEVWEKWVNEHGGIKADGKTYGVEVLYYDDESDPVRSARLTERLITEDNVNFLAGPYSSSITFATTAIGEKYGVITIASTANARNIYERGYKNVFSVLPPAPLLMAPIAYMMDEVLEPRPKTVAIVVANDLFPLDVATGFNDICTELGFDVVMFEKYPPGSTDLSALLTKVKALDADILAGGGYTADALMILRQCKELDYTPKMFASIVGVFVPGFLKEIGADGNYAVEGEWWVPAMKTEDHIFGTTENYLQACVDMFGDDFIANYQTAAASATVSIIQMAIEKAGTIETEQVRDALKSFDVIELACFSPVEFAENGENIQWEHPVIQIQNEVVKVVYPLSSQESAPLYPAPTWKER